MSPTRPSALMSSFAVRGDGERLIAQTAVRAELIGLLVCRILHFLGQTLRVGSLSFLISRSHGGHVKKLYKAVLSSSFPPFLVLLNN